MEAVAGEISFKSSNDKFRAVVYPFPFIYLAIKSAITQQCRRAQTRKYSHHDIFVIILLLQDFGIWA